MLRISTDTVLRALRKKEAALASVNNALLRTIDPAEILVDIAQAGEAEVDERWSFVGHKGNPRWLWHAIDHHTGAVLASVFGRRKDDVFVQRNALLEPFRLTRFSASIMAPATPFCFWTTQKHLTVERTMGLRT